MVFVDFFTGLLQLLGLVAVNEPCPVVVPPVSFDIDRYIEKTWYIQRQQVNSYQPADRLYCVAATYEIEGKQQWFKDAITVNNYSNQGQVNGPVGGGELCATRPNPINEPGKLQVAPCFLPPFLAGPYWVAALDEADYQWAVVVGGQPTIDVSDGENNLCTTPEDAGLFNLIGGNEGLWYLTRAQVASPATIAEMEAAALAAGIGTSRMVDVQQEGCNYEGAVIKA